MDPQTLPNDQLGDVDPLELEDQELPEEEVGELAHIEEAAHDDQEQKTVQEEQDLTKAIDAVAAPVEEASADADAPVAKKSSHMIPRELIDKDLEVNDLYDEGRL